MRLAPKSSIPAVEALICLAVTQAGMWLPPSLVLNRVVESALRGRDGNSGDIDRGKALARTSASAVRRWPGSPLCLQRSLTLLLLLRLNGVDGRLRIGVRRHDDELNAHAWVEIAGVPVNERAEVGETFGPFVMPTPYRPSSLSFKDSLS